MSQKYLVQILLPITRAAGPVPTATLEQVSEELSDRFGGVTAYTRTPATGLWKTSDETDRDTVVMVEVVVNVLDREWWAAYRQSLEQRFHQELIHTRALPIESV